LRPGFQVELEAVLDDLRAPEELVVLDFTAGKFVGRQADALTGAVEGELFAVQVVALGDVDRHPDAAVSGRRGAECEGLVGGQEFVIGRGGVEQRGEPRPCRCR